METEQAKEVIARLKALRGYDKTADELLKIAAKYSRNHTHLFETVSDILERESICPTPAVLRGYLTAGKSANDDGWKQHRVCPYGLCFGDGWRVFYSLHTRTQNSTTKEFITAEQAADLRKKIDPQVQAIYEGVAPCRCAGDVIR